MSEKEKLIKERNKLMLKFVKLLDEFKKGKWDKTINKALKRLDKK